LSNSFYTSVFARGNKIYYRGFDKNGRRVNETKDYAPYLFVESQKGDFKTIDGKSAEKIQFQSIKEAKDFATRYADVSNFKIYGLQLYAYAFINDSFPGEMDFDIEHVKIGMIDLECRSDDGFPDIDTANKEITAITIRHSGFSYVFGCGDFTPLDKNTIYYKCDNEAELLLKFLEIWEWLDLDVISGWNTEFFDIPYIVNRIARVLGEDYTRRLSPWGIITGKEVEFKGKTSKTYEIAGINHLDYYKLYRKFTFSNHESYKLDAIAEAELGEKKLDYSEHGSLENLWKNDYQKFIEYNIKDAFLVERLEDKLKFIEQVISMAYDAKVNYIDIMSTVRPWDVIIHNYLLDQKIVVPPMTKHHMPRSLDGGFVKDPKIGLSNWVVSFDLTSLYPHLIMGYNISPDTFLGTSNARYKLLDDGTIELQNPPANSKCVVTANGCMYSREKQGFMAALMESKFNDRSRFKKLMLQAEKEVERLRHEINSVRNEDASLIEALRKAEKDVSRYHNKQLAKKIQLNSLYGALANEFNRWFSFYNAEATTTTGQLVIKFIDRIFNIYLNRILKTEGVDYVIASDTDSVYIEFDRLVQILGSDKSPETITKAIDAFCEQKIQPYLNKCFELLAIYTRAFEQRMNMKRETIAEKGIWKAKKMYVLNAWNIEGVQFDKPKLKIKGMSAVRSSTPHVCRDSIKKAFEIIMSGNEDDLIKFVDDVRNKFRSLPFEQIAFPRGVSGMTVYYDPITRYKKGTPVQVKGAIIYNSLLKKHDIRNITPLRDGDKIRFAYLKIPNPSGDSVIASLGDIPSEFGLDKFIDRDKQFERGFLEPLRSITDIIGWDVERRFTLDKFFL
jgi:DNA polymerase elongation subunit (family B)